MEGYIRSLSPNWRHIFKRAVRPGGTIPLEDLYESYGKKFIDWLKEVKLRNEVDSWEISMINEKAPKKEKKAKTEKEEQIDDAASKTEKSTRIANQLTIEDIVELPVRKAREIIPNITDLKLLKYALKEAKPRANKDSLCRILEKRIKDVEIQR